MKLLPYLSDHSHGAFGAEDDLVEVRAARDARDLTEGYGIGGAVADFGIEDTVRLRY